jgi:hypothetical protein
MRSNLFANILQSIRGRGHQDSLKSLKKAGYERLTVLTVRDLDEAIARAVDSTLKEYGIALEEGALRGLTGEAQTAFLKLVQERNELREVNESLEREKKNLAGQGALIRQEVTRTQSLLESEKKSATAPESKGIEVSSVEKQLRDAARFFAEEHVLKLGDPPDRLLAAEFHALANEIVGVALKVLDDANAKFAESSRKQHEERVALLEARVRKLQGSLSETEAMLARVSLASQEEPGIASKYKAVQGLSTNDNRFEQKKHLLRQVFDLNVELRRLMADNGTENSAG